MSLYAFLSIDPLFQALEMDAGDTASALARRDERVEFATVSFFLSCPPTDTTLHC